MITIGKFDESRTTTCPIDFSIKKKEISSRKMVRENFMELNFDSPAEVNVKGIAVTYLSENRRLLNHVSFSNFEFTV